jgi:hypothetical protein
VAGRGGASGTGGAGGIGGIGGTGGTSGTGGTGGAPCVVELLTSGDFDGNNTSWTQVMTNRALIYDYNPLTLPAIVPAPVSSPRLAWLGYDAMDSQPALRQSFQVPANAVQLNIAGWYYIQTDEVSPCACDLVYVELERPMAGGGVTTTQLEMWGNADENLAWAQFGTTVNATGVAGQTVTLQLRAKMDSGGKTSFFFDSVSVTVCQ